MNWREKKVTISLGAIAVAVAVAWQSYPQVGKTFKTLHGDYAKYERVELIATSLAKSNDRLSLVIVQSQLRELRDELLTLKKFEKAAGPTEYTAERMDKINSEIDRLEPQEAVLLNAQ